MLRTIAIVLLGCVASSALAADAAKPATSPSFTTSYWCGPPAKFLTVERFQEVKDANFTLAFPPCTGLSVADNRKMLDHCQKVGMKAMIFDSRMPLAIGGGAQNKATIDAIVKDYGDHPALYAYHITDEPAAGAFDGLGEVVAYLKEKDPKHPGFINLLPTYGREFNALGTKTYEEYVRQYVQKVKPFVISYDHYHFTGAGDRSDFYENLETVRKVSLESGIPFWNIVLATEHFNYRHLTEPELRFEAMQTLAYGAHGLLWFTYWMPEGIPSPEGWKHSMINLDGTRDPHYDMIKTINGDVLAIGAELVKAKSTAVIREARETGDSLISPTGPRKYTVGVFKADGGKNLALVTNGDYKHAMQSQWIVKPMNANVERFDPKSKTWSAAKMGDGGVSIEVPAGGGVLLRW